MSLQAQLSRLQQGELGRSKPAGLAHIRALLLRAEQQRPEVAQLLTDRARRALARLQQSARLPPAIPPGAGQCQQPPTAGITGLRALVRQLTAQDANPNKTASGMELDDYLRQKERELLGQSAAVEPEQATAHAENSAAPIMELRAARRLRQSLAAEHTASLLHRAIEESPDSPGPLNPQMLATRALTSMRQLSPQYFNRFVSHIDTLLYLEKCCAQLPGKDQKKSPAKKRHHRAK